MVGILEQDLEKYRPLLKLHIRTMQLHPRLRRRFDSSDLVQDAFVKVQEHREQFAGSTEGQFVNWLKQIVANVVRDKCSEHQAGKRDVRREKDVNQVVLESSVRLKKMVAGRELLPHQRLEQHEGEIEMAAALEQLPAAQRDAIILRHVHELSLPQAAEQMGRSEKAVSHLVYRARQTLRKILDKNQ